jgi:hypothetical protein
MRRFDLRLRPGARYGRFAPARARAGDVRVRGGGVRAILGAIFAAHSLLGSAVMMRDAFRSWRPPEWDVAARADASGLSRAVAAMAAVVPPRDTVLYVTPSSDDYRFWSYAMVSTLAYPRVVWWSTPAARRSRIDWWMQAPFEVGGVLPLAQRKGAAALLMDWNGELPPAGVDARAVHGGRLLLLVSNESQTGAGRAGLRP